MNEIERKQIQEMIDASLSKYAFFATRKYGDTPVDNLQLVPKKYVDAHVSSVVTSSVAAGANTQVQFNDNGALGASSKFKYNKAAGGAFTLDTPDGSASGSGGGIFISTGNGGATSGNGGLIEIAAGNAPTDGDGGYIDIIAGNGGTTGGNGESISLIPGDAAGGNGNGGGVNILLGSKNGSGVDGRFKITGLPTSAAGLPVGAVWNNASVLTIV